MTSWRDEYRGQRSRNKDAHTATILQTPMAVPNEANKVSSAALQPSLDISSSPGTS